MTEPATSESDGPLAGRASRGAMWLTLQSWVSRLSGFVTIAVLARLLTPADFGVVTIAMSVLTMVYLIADLGFTTYLVQTPHVDQRTTSTTFWASTGVGVLLATLLAAAAPAVAALMDAPEAAAVITALAPAVILVSVAATPIALLRRQMRFRALSVQGATAALIGQAVALVLAFAGAGVWALVAQILVALLVTLVFAWLSAKWMPRGRPALALLPGMLGFGGKVMGVDFAAVGRQWAENAVISRSAGVVGLGELGIAQRLVQTVRDMSGAAIAPVATVVFARVRDQPERLVNGYRRSLGLSFAATAPALVVVAVLAPVIVPLMFGGQWSASVVPAAALAIAGIVGLAAYVDHGLFYGLGRPGVWFVYAIIVEIAQLTVTIITVRWGIAAVAWGFVGLTAAATVVRWVLVARLLSRSVREIAMVSIAPLLVVAVSAVVGQVVYLVLAPSIPASPWQPFVLIFAVGAVIAATHVLMLRLVLADVLAEARSLLLGRLRGRAQKTGRENDEQ